MYTQKELLFYSGGIWVYWNDTPDDVLNRFKKEQYERAIAVTE